jgi:hypothetical protein
MYFPIFPKANENRAEQRFNLSRCRHRRCGAVRAWKEMRGFALSGDPTGATDQSRRCSSTCRLQPIQQPAMLGSQLFVGDPDA